MHELFDRVLELPTKQQVACLVLAVEKALPVWERWEVRHCRSRAGHDLLQACRTWVAGSLPDDRLAAIRRKFQRIKKRARADESDLLAANLGYALHAIPLVALRQCKEVHSDIFITSVVSAAEACCGVVSDHVVIDVRQLAGEVKRWIIRWWQECCRRFPELEGNTKALRRLT
jgi:hypothetical protein